MLVTEVRKYMEAAVEKLTPAKAQEMARSLLEGQSKGREQVQKVAQDLMDWSNQTRERMSEMVRREVARQLETMGVASRDEVETLEARVRDLERARRSSTRAPVKGAAASASKRRASAASAGGRSPAKTTAKAGTKATTKAAATSTATSAARRSSRSRPGGATS
jgi:polyhydroxyalkanoate synthesis regulator phasin